MVAEIYPLPDDSGGRRGYAEVMLWMVEEVRRMDGWMDGWMDDGWTGGRAFERVGVSE